jgi:hypothetical protein
MRAVGLSDLDVATRALLASPRAQWPEMARQLVEEAHAADLWRKRYGVGHPKGGTGSLYAQACLYAPVASSRCTAAYLSALKEVVIAVEDWRNRHHKVL